MRKAILAVSCLATAVALSADVTEVPLSVKPGLWQIERTLKYSGLPPNVQAMYDRLTPEQREAMGYGTAYTFKTCVTEKQLHTAWTQGHMNCNWTVLKSTSSELNVRSTSCSMGKNEGLTSIVDVKIQALDSEHVQGNIHGTANGNGVNATFDGTYVGKRIGATCPGNTK